MKTTKLLIILAVFAGIIGLASDARASTIPTLNLSISSPGYTMVSVNGDPNSAVQLYYYTGTAGGSEVATTGSLGSTNSFGYFSTTLNDATYDIPYGAQVYVNVDGQNSAAASWPNYYSGGGNTGGTTGGLSLSQTNVSLQINQTTSVTAYNYNYQTLVVAGNTDSAVVTATVIGNQVDITGISYGSATITICESGTNLCGTVYVTVSSSITAPTYPSYPYPSYPSYPYYPNPTYPIVPQQIIYSQPVSFSTNNVSLNAGSSDNVQIYGSGNYYIYSNSNQNVVGASISGNWLYLQGILPGTSNIIVCENYGNTSCASLSVDIIALQTIRYPWQPTYYPPYISYNPYSSWNW